MSEDECYARCYGGWEATVHVIEGPPPRPALLVEGELLRRRFEEYLDARDPSELAEPEAA